MHSILASQDGAITCRWSHNGPAGWGPTFRGTVTQDRILMPEDDVHRSLASILDDIKCVLAELGREDMIFLWVK